MSYYKFYDILWLLFFGFLGYIIEGLVGCLILVAMICAFGFGAKFLDSSER